VPVIAPVEVFSERPAGSAGVTDHVYGPVPPDAATVAEYDWPTPPVGKLVVEIWSCAANVGATDKPKTVSTTLRQIRVATRRCWEKARERFFIALDPTAAAGLPQR